MRARRRTPLALLPWTTRERLAQRSRDSSFAMAKRASGASEHGRVLVVLSERERGARSYARSPVKPAAPGRLRQCRRVIGAAPAERRNAREAGEYRAGMI